MAAIARAPDESLPRQLGSAAGAKAAYRLFDCGAVTRAAVMDPPVAQCRAEQRQLEDAERLVPLLGALAIVAVRLLRLRDAARHDGAAPAAVPQTTIQILAAKLQQPAEGFTTNRNFLRGVARFGGFLARKSDGEPGWLTIWKGWFVLSILVEGFELAQAIASVQ